MSPTPGTSSQARARLGTAYAPRWPVYARYIHLGGKKKKKKKHRHLQLGTHVHLSCGFWYVCCLLQSGADDMGQSDIVYVALFVPVIDQCMPSLSYKCHPVLHAWAIQPRVLRQYNNALSYLAHVGAVLVALGGCVRRMLSMLPMLRRTCRGSLLPSREDARPSLLIMAYRVIFAYHIMSCLSDLKSLPCTGWYGRVHTFQGLPCCQTPRCPHSAAKWHE